MISSEQDSNVDSATQAAQISQESKLTLDQIRLIESYLAPVNNIALTAGEAIMAIYQHRTAVNIEHKSDNSPVTDADLAADHVIRTALTKLNPNIPILSEEYLPEWDIRQHWSTYWLVDPLDGTREFIKRNGEFTVNIALILEGRPVLGVIYAPAQDALYWGANQQAWKLTAGIKTQIFAKQHYSKQHLAKQNDPIYVSVSRSHRCAKIDEYLATLSDFEIKTVGSSLKFCWLAEGKIQLYPRANSISIWDIAAGEAIVLASGGKMTDWQGNMIDYRPQETFAAPPFKAWFGDILR